MVASVLLNACKRTDARTSSPTPEVTATEDLMREHGVLRRILVVYREAASRLRGSTSSVPPATLQSAATLFRAFGEDYHERKLEEAYIFPAVKAAGGPAARYVDTLLAQHERGRQITDYLLTVARSPKFTTNALALADVLDEFVRMYEPHTAIEDTEIFTAWKKALSPQKLDELGDVFEDIEHATFGKAGFDDAVDEVRNIEQRLGLSDLSTFTAAVPPKAV